LCLENGLRKWYRLKIDESWEISTTISDMHIHDKFQSYGTQFKNLLAPLQEEGSTASQALIEMNYKLLRSGSQQLQEEGSGEEGEGGLKISHIIDVRLRDLHVNCNRETFAVMISFINQFVLPPVYKITNILHYSSISPSSPASSSVSSSSISSNKKKN